MVMKGVWAFVMSLVETEKEKQRMTAAGAAGIRASQEELGWGHGTGQDGTGRVLLHQAFCQSGIQTHSRPPENATRPFLGPGMPF